jgi:hypothetical protein
MAETGAPVDDSLVSVLIPAFNAGRWLPECLDSILGQTHRAIETIVVDDGSTDDTLSIARSFEARGVKVISQANGGQPAALNTALSCASGAYIQFVDADDLLHPDKIAVQLRRLRREPALTVASGAWTRFLDNPENAVLTPEAVWRDLDPVDWAVSSWCGGGMMPVMAWLFPRALTEMIGGWDESLRWASNGLDGHYCTKALLAARKHVFCPEAISFYRSVEGSQSKAVNQTSVEANLAVVLSTGEMLLKVEDSARTRTAFAANLQRFIHATYPDQRHIVAIAERRLKELGGSDLAFDAGPATASLGRLIGWRAAKRLRRLAGAITRRTN